MPVEYADSPTEGTLWQGEVLLGAWEYRPRGPAIQPVEGGDAVGAARSQPIQIERLLVMTNVCDLQQDFAARPSVSPENRKGDWEASSPHILPYLLVCELYDQANVRQNAGLNSGLWAYVKTNQHPRYHLLDQGVVRQRDGQEIGQIAAGVLDFRRPIALPGQAVYEALDAGSIGRSGILVDPYSHDVMQRFFSYQGRVGVPE